MAKQIIEADKPLSQSLLWEIQRAYFLSQGVKAWQENVVPSAISSSPVMARAYSQILLGYLRDCHAAALSGAFELDTNQPIYIVELGAGSGRLAYHFLHTFYPLFQASPLSRPPIKYVLTDFVPEIVAFWQVHDRFQPWIAAGLLDFALFDATDRRPLSLINSGEPLMPEAVKNPLVLVANYFFDSIPQDSFVIEEGVLSQNLLTLSSSRPEPDLADPTIWDRLEMAYEAIPLEKPHYHQPLYHEILDDYEARLPQAAFSFPNVGLDCLQFWQAYGSGRLLLLTSDRGYTLAESLFRQDDSLPNLHGSFSLLVNYHAVGEYVRRCGGMVCQVPHYQDNIQVLATLLGQIPQGGLETRQAFDLAVGQGGPDDFFALKSVVENNFGAMSLSELLSFLRLSGWDADVLVGCLPYLHKQLLQAEPVWFPDVHQALARVLQRYLPLSESDELVEEISRLTTLMNQNF